MSSLKDECFYLKVSTVRSTLNDVGLSEGLTRVAIMTLRGMQEPLPVTQAEPSAPQKDSKKKILYTTIWMQTGLDDPRTVMLLPNQKDKNVDHEITILCQESVPYDISLKKIIHHLVLVGSCYAELNAMSSKVKNRKIKFLEYFIWGANHNKYVTLQILLPSHRVLRVGDSVQDTLRYLHDSICKIAPMSRGAKQYNVTLEELKKEQTEDDIISQPDDWTMEGMPNATPLPYITPSPQPSSSVSRSTISQSTPNNPTYAPTYQPTPSSVTQFTTMACSTSAQNIHQNALSGFPHIPGRTTSPEVTASLYTPQVVPVIKKRTLLALSNEPEGPPNKQISFTVPPGTSKEEYEEYVRNLIGSGSAYGFNSTTTQQVPPTTTQTHPEVTAVTTNTHEEERLKALEFEKSLEERDKKRREEEEEQQAAREEAEKQQQSQVDTSNKSQPNTSPSSIALPPNQGTEKVANPSLSRKPVDPRKSVGVKTPAEIAAEASFQKNIADNTLPPRH